MLFQPGVDECCYKLARAPYKGRSEGWSFNFVRSIHRHNKRRNWEPTPKQLDNMRGLVADLTRFGEPLIGKADNEAA